MNININKDLVYNIVSLMLIIDLNNFPLSYYDH